MLTEITVGILGVLVGVLAIIAGYHIALRQGLFAKNKLYINFISPVLLAKADYKPPLSDIIIFGIPSKKTNSVFLFFLPICIENKSKESIRNVRIVIAYDEKLNSKWARDQFPDKIKRESGIDREYVLNNYYHTEYLVDTLRLEQRTALLHFISFNVEDFGQSDEINKGIQKKISSNLDYKTYFSEVMLLVSGDNIKETKVKVKLLITDYKSMSDFLNKQSRDLADEFFVNSISFLSGYEYLKRYFSQIIDRGISKRVFLNIPNFKKNPSTRIPVYSEDFEASGNMWWEKKYRVVSPFKLLSQIKKRDNYQHPMIKQLKKIMKQLKKLFSLIRIYKKK